MFSKELQILDRNTTQYMVDEMQKELDEKEQVLEEQKMLPINYEKGATDRRLAHFMAKKITA